MELTDHDSRIIKTDKNYRHLSPETPSQGIIAQTPQFVSNMHFSTRTLKTFANSEKKKLGTGLLETTRISHDYNNTSSYPIKNQ